MVKKDGHRSDIMREDFQEIEAIIRKEKPITKDNFHIVVNAATDMADDWDSIRESLIKESNDFLRLIDVDYTIEEADILEPSRIESAIAETAETADVEKLKVGSLLSQYFQSHLYADTTMKILKMALFYAIDVIEQLKTQIELEKRKDVIKMSAKIKQQELQERNESSNKVSTEGDINSKEEENVTKKECKMLAEYEINDLLCEIFSNNDKEKDVKSSLQKKIKK